MQSTYGAGKFLEGRLMSARDGLRRFLTRFPRLLSLVRTIRSMLSPDERIIRRLQRDQGKQFFSLPPRQDLTGIRHFLLLHGNGWREKANSHIVLWLFDRRGAAIVGNLST